MSKFKRRTGKKMQALSTASLPDIVFMLLFFFMVTTVMKDQETLVNIEPAKASQTQVMTQKSLINFIYAGTTPSSGNRTVIQLNDQEQKPILVTIREDQLGRSTDIYNLNEKIRKMVEDHRENLNPDEKNKQITSIKADKNTEMKIISDIKIGLRKAGSLKINYAVEDEE